MSREDREREDRERDPVTVEEAGESGVGCEEPLAEAGEGEGDPGLQGATASAPLMDLHILYDRVLVKRFPPREVTSGGIFTPEDAREAPQEGRVLMVGEGRPLGRVRYSSDRGGDSLPYMEVAPLKIRVADVVVFGKHSGVSIEVSGENLLLLREDEILAYWREREQAGEGEG